MVGANRELGAQAQSSGSGSGSRIQFELELEGFRAQAQAQARVQENADDGCQDGYQVPRVLDPQQTVDLANTSWTHARPQTQSDKLSSGAGGCGVMLQYGGWGSHGADDTSLPSQEPCGVLPLKRVYQIRSTGVQVDGGCSVCTETSSWRHYWPHIFSVVF
jgi:hypothetical protein